MLDGDMLEDQKTHVNHLIRAVEHAKPDFRKGIPGIEGWRLTAPIDVARLTYGASIPRFLADSEATDAAFDAQPVPASAGVERALRALARDLPADHGHLFRDRRTRRLSDFVAPARPALAGHDPKRDGGSGGAGPAVRGRTPRPDGCRPNWACACSWTVLMELGGLTEAERAAIDVQCQAVGRSMPEVMEQASTMLSGLSHCAGMVVSPKTDRPLKHIEFVHLGPGRALVVLVTEGGMVENRVIDVPVGPATSALVEATNYLTQRLAGPHHSDGADRDHARSRKPAGRARRAGTQGGGGRSRLLVDGRRARRADRPRPVEPARRRHRGGRSRAAARLFAALEAKEQLLKLLEAADVAEGVQIFNRRGERIVRPRRLLGGDLALSRQPAAADRRGGRDRAEPDQLRADHPDGRLHRQGDRPDSRVEPPYRDRWATAQAVARFT